MSNLEESEEKINGLLQRVESLESHRAEATHGIKALREEMVETRSNISHQQNDLIQISGSLKGTQDRLTELDKKLSDIAEADIAKEPLPDAGVSHIAANNRSTDESPFAPIKRRIDALADSSNVARNLLIILQAATIGALIFILSTTDEALFFDRTEPLPTLGVAVSMYAIYLTGSPLFLFFYWSLLEKLDLIAERCAAVAIAGRPLLNAQEATRDQLIKECPGFAFSQHILHRALGLQAKIAPSIILWISIVLGPIGVLALAQVSFVRYQDMLVSLLQAAVTGAAIILLVVHLTKVERHVRSARCPADITSERTWEKGKWVCSQFCSGIVATVAILYSVAALPPQIEEFDDKKAGAAAALPAIEPGLEKQSRAGRLEWLGRNLLDRLICDKGLGCRTLYIEFTDLSAASGSGKARSRAAGNAGGGAGEPQHALAADRDRNFRFARFNRITFVDVAWIQADLRGASFDGAFLNRNRFRDSKLDGASFKETKLIGSTFEHVVFRSVSFQRTVLRMARFDQVDMIGQSISDSDLSGVRIIGGDWSGVRFCKVKLDAITIVPVKLPIKPIMRSPLTPLLPPATTCYCEDKPRQLPIKMRSQGAPKSEASFPTDKVSFAQAQLCAMKLQGAWLSQVDFTNANLTESDFNGTYLDNINIDGAHLRNAHWRGAWLHDVSGKAAPDQKLRTCPLIFPEEAGGEGLTCTEGGRSIRLPNSSSSDGCNEEVMKTWARDTLGGLCQDELTFFALMRTLGLKPDDGDRIPGKINLLDVPRRCTNMWLADREFRQQNFERCWRLAHFRSISDTAP